MSAEPLKSTVVRTVLLLALLCTSPLFAEQISYDFFRNKPRSLAKDFYISRYLDQNISVREARSLLADVKNMNWKLFYKFADKVDDSAFSRVAYCRKLPASQYEGKDNDCIKIGLTPYKATKIPPQQLIRIASQIAPQYPDDAALYWLIAKRDFNQSIRSGAKLFLRLLNQTGNSYRQKYLDHPLPPAFLNELATHRQFNIAIDKIVRNPQLTHLQRSILKLDSTRLNAQSNLLLGLNALNLGHPDIAIWYFRLSRKKARFNYDRDKALFWEYLSNQDPALLHKLIRESKDINIYTLYAYEKLGLFPDNLLTTTHPQKARAPFDITDPFAWLKIKKHFKSLHFQNDEARRAAAMAINSRESEPHIAALLYRYRDNKHYYLFPWYDAISTLPKKRQALLLALARQESRFIPTEVSYSYALGLMQFMPFLARAIAKEKEIADFRYEMLFDPRIAYAFADSHLDYLEKFLKHPLLIAYAYNGGIGYTRRQIVQKEHCFGEGAYEPFMSMELLPNAQARRYGKKVLANYVVYARLLGLKKERLLTLLQKLKSKHHISCF